MKRIRNLWAENRNQSALEVYRRSRRLARPPKVSERKVQSIVAEARAESTASPFPLDEWRPWEADSETPEDTAFLLRLDAISFAAYGRHLYKHEARWGKRIRTAVRGLSPYLQWVLARMYGLAEQRAFYLQEPDPYTADLDGLLAYQPWRQGGQTAYELAVAAGVVPAPLMSGLSTEIPDLVEHFKQFGLPAPESRELYLRDFHVWEATLRNMDDHALLAFHHGNREDEPFTAWMVDRVVDFWADEGVEQKLSGPDQEEEYCHEGLD